MKEEGEKVQEKESPHSRAGLFDGPLRLDRVVSAQGDCFVGVHFDHRPRAADDFQRVARAGRV